MANEVLKNSKSAVVVKVLVFAVKTAGNVVGRNTQLFVTRYNFLTKNRQSTEEVEETVIMNGVSFTFDARITFGGKCEINCVLGEKQTTALLDTGAQV